MGEFSVFHFVVLFVALLVGLVPTFLPIWIVPSGPNRFGPSAPSQSFLSATMAGFRKYFDFHGRASRSEFWWFFLASILIWYLATLVIGTVGYFVPYFYGASWAVSILLMLGFILPLVSMTVRRLHDLNRSGWWALLMIFGYYVTLIVLLAWPSQRDEVTEVF